MDNLNSILNEQAETEETQVEQVEDHTEGQEAAGETTTPPVVEQEEEDEGTKRIKGLEAAAAAERRRRQQAEQNNQQLAEELERLRRGQPQQAKPQVDGLARPKRDAFASQEEYEDALLEYGDKRREHRAQQEMAQRQQEQYIAARQAALTEVVKKGQAKHRDFDAVINDGLAPFLTPTLQDALLALDQPEDVAHWLGRNPADAAKVAALPPAKMLKALGAIEATKLGADERQSIPQTLTQARNASGQFHKPYSGPTPLDDILGRKT